MFAVNNFPDQLELEEAQHKKRHFLHRKNRTAPAPLGPAGSKFQHSLYETDLSGMKKPNQKQEKRRPIFLRKEAFVEDINVSQGSPVSIKKKWSVGGKSNLFCINSGSASSEHLENSDSHLENCNSSHEKNSADSKNRKKPHIGELKLTNTKVQPLNTEASLSNSSIQGGIQPQVESNKVTVMKQRSSNSFAVQNNEGSHDLGDQVSAILVRQWSTDKRSIAVEDGDTTCNQLNDAEKSGPKQQSCDESKSRGTSRQNSAQQGGMRLKKQSSVDETSSSDTRSQMGSQHLSDSGFVSPKNVLPPIRLTSSVDKPPWSLPPLSSQAKHSSQGEIFSRKFLCSFFCLHIVHRDMFLEHCNIQMIVYACISLCFFLMSEYETR
jgi:hypothetical protein